MIAQASGSWDHAAVLTDRRAPRLLFAWLLSAGLIAAWLPGPLLCLGMAADPLAWAPICSASSAGQPGAPGDQHPGEQHGGGSHQGGQHACSACCAVAHAVLPPPAPPVVQAFAWHAPPPPRPYPTGWPVAPRAPPIQPRAPPPVSA